MNPKCCICGNAYGTYYVCATCKADPANDGWVEGSEREQAMPDVARLAEHRGMLVPDGSTLRQRVLRLREVGDLHGKLSVAQIAKTIGRSERYVWRVLAEASEGVNQ